MAYKRKPVYHFNDLTETGIDKVPLNRLIILESNSSIYIKMSNSGLGNTSTIQNAIDNTAITGFKLSGMTVGEDGIPVYKGFSEDGTLSEIDYGEYSNANSIDINSKYNVNTANVSNMPMSVGYVILDTIILDSNTAIQTAYDYANNTVYKRIKASGTWGAWIESVNGSGSSSGGVISGTANLIALGGL